MRPCADPSENNMRTNTRTLLSPSRFYVQRMRHFKSNNLYERLKQVS